MAIPIYTVLPYCVIPFLYCKLLVLVKIRSLRESSKVDRFAAKVRGEERLCLYLGRFTAFCLPALTDFFSRFSSPESFASLSVVPPSNCVPRVPTPTAKKSTSWGVKVWQMRHDERGGCKATLLVLYILTSHKKRVKVTHF